MENNSKPSSLRSTWETYTTEELKEKLESMLNEFEYLQDAIGKAENELFYRANPECREV